MAAAASAWCHLDFDFSERSMVTVVPKQFCIGRHPKNQLVEADERVSAFHCQLLFKEDGDCEVMDTSTYGTFINGKKIGKGNTKPVKEGDVIAVILGEPTLIFTFRDRRGMAGQPTSGSSGAPLAKFESSGNKVVPNLPPPEESVIASRFGPASAMSVPAPIPAIPALQGSYDREGAPPPPPPPLDPPPPPPAFAESDNALLSQLPPPEESVINYGHKEGDTVGYAAC